MNPPLQFLKTRDPEAFQELVKHFEQSVFRLVASVLGPYASTSAEEVTQDVFLRVYRDGPSFEGRAKFSTWLYRVAYNAAIDRKRTTRHELRNAPLREGCEIASDEPSASARLIAAEQRAELAECMEALPDLYRTLLNLYYWQEISVNEIAELLEMNPGTVKSYLARAREKMAAQLARRGWNRR